MAIIVPIRGSLLYPPALAVDARMPADGHQRAPAGLPARGQVLTWLKPSWGRSEPRDNSTNGTNRTKGDKVND